MSRGRLRVPITDNDPLFVQTEEARESIKAISVTHLAMDWWRSEAGMKYWDANRRALGRGVEIERIFVADEPGQDVRKLAQAQANEGVTAWFVTRDQCPPGLLSDTVVWDRKFTYDLVLNSAGEAIAYIFSVNDEDIETKLANVSLLKTRAQRVVSTKGREASG